MNLLQMLYQAYEAMQSEAMSCPWCEDGYIGGAHEHHAHDCPWLIHSAAYEAWREQEWQKTKARYLHES